MKHGLTRKLFFQLLSAILCVAMAGCANLHLVKPTASELARDFSGMIQDAARSDCRTQHTSSAEYFDCIEPVDK